MNEVSCKKKTKSESLASQSLTHSAARTTHPTASGHAREGKSFGRARKGAISQLCRGLWGDRASHRCDCSMQPLRPLSCSAWWPPATWEPLATRSAITRHTGDLMRGDRHPCTAICGREDMRCHCDVTRTNFNLQNNWMNTLCGSIKKLDLEVFVCLT